MSENDKVKNYVQINAKNTFKSFSERCIHAKRRAANKSPVPVRLIGNLGIRIFNFDSAPPEKIYVMNSGFHREISDQL